MSKRIAFCADGTWDSSASRTNVYKLFKSLAVGANQMPFYDDGVGANMLPIEKFLGGAFGIGLFDKIKEAYTKISQVYEEGDDLYIFGFSRGAYTARSLAGMIAVCGLPTKNFTDDLVETAFNAYRNKDNNRAQLLNSLNGRGMFDAKITMVGVWDTVGALGIPALLGGVDPLLYGFLDTSLHPDVLNACHALAIDERRLEFPATLWSSNPASGQTIEQIWFCGAHGDIGGGEPSDGSDTTALSDIPLAWMMEKASALGLQFAADAKSSYSFPVDPKYALDKMHESWNPIWGFPKHRSIGDKSVIANSAVLRAQHDDSWHPPNLQFVNGLPGPMYTIAPIVSLPKLAAGAHP